MHSVSEGHASTNVVPANRSIIIADSRFRTEDVTDTPYDFKCDLGGTAIYAKEIYYQKLYWNQPLFSHNNTNCEIRFQMNNDETKTYVVYVTPFVIFKEFDGNPEGQYLANPQAYSYARNLTNAFGGDVRLLQSNQTLVNGNQPNPGYVYDSFGNQVVIYMRYSAAKGFCVSMEQNSPVPGNYYSIRFLPCSWIAKAHFVHGFGIYDPKISTTEMVPHSFFSACIWSDTAPSLLPTRYVVIQSPELNKDRRLISFHNGNSANFINELAIFSLNRLHSGAFHEVSVGDDATVVSLRKEYTPQSFRIQILDENGKEIRCGDPITKLLSSQGIDPAVLLSFLPPSTNAGRGSPSFMNYLVFGYGVFADGVPKGPIYNFPNILLAPLLGMKGLSLPYQHVDYDNLSVPQHIDIAGTLPLWVEFPAFSPSAAGPFPQGSGFAQNTNMTAKTPAWWYACPNQTYTVFTWYPDMNLHPSILWDYYFPAVTPGPIVGPTFDGWVYLTMFDASNLQIIQTVRVLYNPTPYLIVPLVSEALGYKQNWEVNPDYVFPPSPATIAVGFSMGWVGLQSGGYAASFNLMYAPHAYTWKFFLKNINDNSNIQTSYIPPNIEGSYTFGDPLASAMCEEVIHEIAGVLEYS